MPLVDVGSGWSVDSRLHDLHRELDRLDGWFREGRITGRELAHRHAVVCARIRRITRPESSEQHFSERQRTAGIAR